MHCYYAMNGLSVNNFGRVRPCCVAKTFKSISGAPGVINSHDLDYINTWPIKMDNGKFGFQPQIQAMGHVKELLNDPVLCHLREKLKKNRRPAECERCFGVEDQGGYSYRMDANETHKHLIHEDSIQEKDGVMIDMEHISYLDVTLGNVCNLQCKTCNPWSSHNWIEEAQVIPHQEHKPEYIPYLKKGRAEPWFVKAFRERFFDPILGQIRTINFLGGEPLVVKEHYEWLKHIINKGWAKNKTLQYTSNGTTIPNALIDLWSHFEHINLGISVDAVGDKAYYIRHPSKWSVIEKNFDKLRQRCKEVKHINVQLHTTVSMLNILDIGEVYEFSRNQYQKFHYFDTEARAPHGYINILPHINIVDFPRYYHIRHLPVELKHQAVKQIELTYNRVKGTIENSWEQDNLNNLNNLAKIIMEDRDPHRWDQFLDVQRASDKFRKLKGSDYLPWMSQYV